MKGYILALHGPRLARWEEVLDCQHAEDSGEPPGPFPPNQALATTAAMNKNQKRTEKTLCRRSAGTKAAATNRRANP
jgi:hypothetical protein